MATEKQEREWWFQSIAEGEHGPLHDWLAVSHNEDGTLNGGSHPAPFALPLDVPTYDGNPSGTHPSVVFVGGDGWKGWNYWMAFTPFPGDDRENPSIVVSRDAVTWQVPSGLTNPLEPAGFNANYDKNSDPCLLLSADESELILYFRAYRVIGGLTAEGIFRMTSSDGITWSDPSLVLSASGNANSHLLSPSVLVEADGSYSMWVVDDSASNDANRLAKRTSTDGITWSDPSTCTNNNQSLEPPWHVDVKRVGSTYYALFPGNGDFRIYFCVSTDAGITWNGSSVRALEPTGTTYDARGNYKSCFVPVDGGARGVIFRTWIIGTDTTGTDTWSANHRLIFYGDLDLLAGVGFKDSDRILLPASAFYTQAGTPSQGLSGSRWPAWLLDSASSEAVAITAAIPSAWRAFTVKLLWSNASTGSGDVYWTLTYQAHGAGGGLGTSDVAAQVTVTAPSKDILAVTSMATGITGINHGPWHFRMTRSGAQAADTLGNDASFIGLMLERTL